MYRDPVSAAKMAAMTTSDTDPSTNRPNRQSLLFPLTEEKWIQLPMQMSVHGTGNTILLPATLPDR
jgi:hypothetical protein